MPDAESAVERAQDADEEAEAVAVHRTDVVAGADRRSPGSRRVPSRRCAVGDPGLPCSTYPSTVTNTSSSGNKLKKRVERDAGRKRTALVVTELLHHSDREAGAAMFSLISIDSPEDRLHVGHGGERTPCTEGGESAQYAGLSGTSPFTCCGGPRPSLTCSHPELPRIGLRDLRFEERAHE